jgi:hypothetical protein
VVVWVLARGFSTIIIGLTSCGAGLGVKYKLTKT